MTRAATIRQADIRRAVEAARKAGVAAVVIEYPGGGKLTIPVNPEGKPERKKVKL